MPINSNVIKNYQTAEYGKFVELANNSNYPPVSVIRWSYPDTTSAFPGNSAAMPLSSVDVYPKYAVITHDIGAYSQLGQAGFDFIVGGQTAASGPYSTIQVVSACKVSSLTAANTTVGDLTAFELPANFAFSGPITGITLQYGAVIVYKL